MVQASDALDLFEDSLGTVFSHVQPMLSSPGELFTYKNGTYGDIEIRLPPQEVTSLFAHYVWRAGILICDLLGQGKIDLCNQTVLEVGAGAALPSLAAVKCGAATVISTDYDEPSLIDNIRFNVKHALAPEQQKIIKVLPLTWGNKAQEDDITDLAPLKFDSIIACDCIWVEYARHPEDALLQSVTRLLKKTAEARFVVCCGFHTGRPVVNRFFDRAWYYGFEPAAPMIEREVGGFEKPFTEEGIFENPSERNRWLVVALLCWRHDRIQA